MEGVQTARWVAYRQNVTSGSLAVITMVGCSDRNTLHLQIVSDENSATIFVVRTFCYECYFMNSWPRFSCTSVFYLETQTMTMLFLAQI